MRLLSQTKKQQSDWRIATVLASSFLSAERDRRSGSSGAPSPMKKALPRREYHLVRKQTDDDDDKHDADNLVHGI